MSRCRGLGFRGFGGTTWVASRLLGSHASTPQHRLCARIGTPKRVHNFPNIPFGGLPGMVRDMEDVDMCRVERVLGFRVQGSFISSSRSLKLSVVKLLISNTILLPP